MNEKEPSKQHHASRFPTFQRIGNSLGLRRVQTGKGFELGKDEFKPGINYRFLKKNWKGPVYFSAKSHRRDLQYVIGQIRSIVRANAPLASGIDAVAREERRSGSGGAIRKAFWITFWFLMGVLTVFFIVEEARFSGMAPLLLALVFLVLAIRERLQGNRTFALLNLVGMIVCIAVFSAIVYISDWRGVLPGLRFFEVQDVVIFMIIASTVACFVVNFRAAQKRSGREMVLLRLRDLLRNGLDLSAAMRQLPRFFPRFYADMVEAGEQTGRMEECLAELCEDVGTDLAVQRQIRGTLLYLCIVGFVQILLMTFLMIKVVPVFFEINSEFGNPPTHTPFFNFVDRFMNAFYFMRWNPFHGVHMALTNPFPALLQSPMTLFKIDIFSIALVLLLVLPVALSGVQIMRNIKSKTSIKSPIFMLVLYIIVAGAITVLLLGIGINVRENNHIWMLPIALIMLLVFIFLRFFRERRRNFSSRPLSSLCLFLPGFRGMVMQDNFTVITGTLEKLLCAGVPLDTAVEKASVGDVNPVYAGMLRRVHTRILEGESLVAAFQQASSGLLVPASFTSLVAVGEQSGMLPEALSYLHSFYRDQSTIRARILVDTIKPFGVLLLGLFVLLFMKDMFTLLTGLTYALLNSM